MESMSPETKTHCLWLWREICSGGSDHGDLITIHSTHQTAPLTCSKAALASACPLLKLCLVEDTEQSIILPDVEPHVLHQFHRFLFTPAAVERNTFSIQLIQFLSCLGVCFDELQSNPDVRIKDESEKMIRDEVLTYKYACSLCNLTFDTFDEAQHHTKESHENGESSNQHHENQAHEIIVSDEVGIVVEDACEQDMFRIPENKKTEKKFNCSECDKRFTSNAQLIHHRNIHLGLKPYTCHLCNKGFTQPTHLKIHMRVHDGERNYMCSICGKTFAIASNMRKHLSIHERENCENRESSDVQGKENEQEDFVPMTNYPCTHCDYSFTSKRDLMTHLVGHEEISPFECKSCDKRFPTEKRLSIHEKREHGKQYVCNFCQKVFVSGSKLSKHILIHTGEKPFNCNICQKAFSQKSHVTFHQNTVHSKDGSKDRRYGCPNCGKRFSTKGILTKHQMLHENDRPFQCTFEGCSKNFVQRSHLKVHLAKHTGDRPFICIECGSSFTTRQHLKEHSQLHSGTKAWYQCTQCDAKYRGKTDLTTHMRLHTGETPFHCKEPGCSKSFRSVRSLENHVRVHTGDKPYTCDTCKKCFTTASGLRQHFKHNLRCQALVKPGSFASKPPDYQVRGSSEATEEIRNVSLKDFQIEIKYTETLTSHDNQTPHQI